MKKIISVISTLLVLLALVLLISPLWACDVPTVEKEAAADTSMFVIVEDTTQWTVVYHKQTKVMYVFSRLRLYSNTGAGVNSSFTVLLDEDGMPLLWSGE